MPIKRNKTKERIAAKVRELRRQRRWTQAELARRLGLSQSRLSELKQSLPRSWAKRCRRAAVVLETFLEYLGSSSAGRPNDAAGPDILDSSIRTKRTLEEVKASSSPVSRRWNIVTGLQPDDFLNALRESRAGL